MQPALWHLRALLAGLYACEPPSAAPHRVLEEAGAGAPHHSRRQLHCVSLCTSGDSTGRVPDSLHSYVQARCGQSTVGADAPVNSVGAGLDSSRQQQHGHTLDHAAAVAEPSSQRPPSANLQYSVAQRMKAAGKKPSLNTRPCQSHIQVSSGSSGWLQV